MNTSNGWICLYRDLLNDELWKDCNPNQKVMMITILLMANHEKNTWIFNGEKYTANAGEFITSLKSLSDNSGLTIQAVRSALLKLEKFNFITMKTTNRNRLIKVINWRKYQDYNVDNNKASNKQTTSKQQANNKQTTTNNNDNNDNNDNKMIDLTSKLQNNIETEKNDRYRFIERFKELTDKTINYQSILNIPAKSLDLLLKEIEQSEYLKKNLTIQFAAKNLEKILSGKYRDFNSGRKNKNKFHNFKQLSDNYGEDYLEDIARKKREEFFKEIGD